MELSGQIERLSEKKWIADDPAKFVFKDRRKHVRIYYGEDWPEKLIPELFINCRGYRVLDISASGIRFAIPSMSLSDELKISGVIHFPKHHIVSISGEVVRYRSDQIAIKLFKEMPNSVIMAEFARLRDLETKGLISSFLVS